jgi:predicted enzyme related to lactoylglutathione lyase
MSLRIASITFDCDDTRAVAQFWSDVLGRPVDEGGSEYFCSIGREAHGDASPTLFFLKVPEPKTAKNRCHLDLQAASRDDVHAEVARLEALGAKVIRTPQEEFGAYWSTLQDPEGNEFCIGAS